MVMTLSIFKETRFC